MPDANTLSDNRTRTSAPGWRGTTSQVIYLEDDDKFYLAEAAETDEFRWYRFSVKNDTSNACEAIDVWIDGTTVVLSSDAGLFDGAEDDAGSINIYWDGTNSRYTVQNKLASSAHAFVAFYRIA